MPLVASDPLSKCIGVVASSELGPRLLACADGCIVAEAYGLVACVAGGGVFFRSLLGAPGCLFSWAPSPTRGGPLDVGSAAAGKDPKRAAAPCGPDSLQKVASPELSALSAWSAAMRWARASAAAFASASSSSSRAAWMPSCLASTAQRDPYALPEP